MYKFRVTLNKIDEGYYITAWSELEAILEFMLRCPLVIRGNDVIHVQWWD